jgi:CubicO group peptidase (beta-lactamase class C family)
LKAYRQTIHLLFALLFAAHVAWSQSAEALAQVRQTVEKAFPSLHTPGLSVAAGVSNRVCWSDGFGFADLEKKTPASHATIYRYASISKPISATAVMQLVEQGKVALDAPIQSYVPGFPQKPQGEITVRHLLTHTSGIRHYRGLEFLSNRRYQSVEEALGIFKDDPLEFKPGAKYQYSSYGYNVLAAVVEKASGKSFRDYLREKIFRPAGMTAADLEFLEEPLTNRCHQYLRVAGSFVLAPEVDLSCKWAGGGIAGTAEDLARFCIALDQGNLLQAKTCAQMYQPGVLSDGSRTDYGLGWKSHKDKHGRVWVGHSGGATGGTTYFVHDPQGQVAVALLTNAQDVKGLEELATRLGEMLSVP